MENVLEKNLHLSNLRQISKLIQGESRQSEIASMLLMSKGLFQYIRSILNDRRQRLREENLEKIMITHAFYIFVF